MRDRWTKQKNGEEDAYVKWNKRQKKRETSRTPACGFWAKRWENRR